MLPPDFFLFLQIIIFLFITPGTPRIVIISYSINYGLKKCVWSATGDVIANFVQATLVIFVIGSFFLDHPKVLNIFKWAGIIYLLIWHMIFINLDQKIFLKIIIFLKVTCVFFQRWFFSCRHKSKSLDVFPIYFSTIY